MDGYLHPKSFLISFAALMFLFVCAVGYVVGTAEHSQSNVLTGKVMASLDFTPKAIIDEPIKTPNPVEHTEPDTKTHAEDNTLPPPPSHEAAHDVTHEVKAEDAPAIEESIEGLSEETPLGFLPIIRKSDGMTAFSAYKAPFALRAETKGVVALVMLDYGLSDKLSKAALEKLPKPMTFSISPYSSIVQAKLTAARAAGHEVWMNIPIQAADFAKNDSGPSTILSGLNKDLNISRLNTSLGRGTGYAGVTFSVTPDFPDILPDLQPVIDSITARGLGISQMDLADKKIAQAATDSKAAFIQASVEIDSSLSKGDILKSLEMLEKISLESGYVTIGFEPSQSAFDAIAEWGKSLDSKHIQLAPLTYAIHQKNLVK